MRLSLYGYVFPSVYLKVRINCPWAIFFLLAARMEGVGL